ncbi:taste receptor type 2 member 4-like [Hyla sarda]|uniref:taste receptor type 2 member 4-like n=1 Tax=Hyla sarda TaxID=327740 RepID=UPI0024C387F4|nr:taste receptor type 2 member 4-like [Hyla sarda]
MAPEILVLLVLNIVTSCSGLFLNTFIAVISCRTRMRNVSQNPRDLLLFSIGLSSVLFGTFQFLTNMAGYIWTDLFFALNFCLIIVNLVFVLSLFSSICLTSLLCSFYCIKLVTFRHRIFTQMRSVFPSLLPWMVAGTFVIPGVVLVTLVGVILMTAPLLHDGSILHCPKINQTYVVTQQAIMTGLNLMTALPFLLIVVSLGVTLSSLTFYVWKLHNSSSFDKSHLRAHSEAAKTMLLLLTLNVLFYLSHLMLSWDLVAVFSPMGIMSFIMYFSFWALQALTLLTRNKTYRVRISALQSLLRMWWNKDIIPLHK